MVTDAQVRRYQEKRMTGHSMAAAAVAAGMSQRTGRRWNGRGLPSAGKEPRTYRTRPDPFADVWTTEIEPRLVADGDGRLQALTLFEWLCERQPNRFRPGQSAHAAAPDARVAGPTWAGARSLFRADADPGARSGDGLHRWDRLGRHHRGRAVCAFVVRMGLELQRMDVCGARAERNVRGARLRAAGRAVDAGAAPTVVRHDNLTAATHELRRSGGRQLNRRFRAVLDHYGLESSRIQPGQAHENGVVEQRHYRTKTAIEQALLLRGHRDFPDEASYTRFVRELLERKQNGPAAARLAEERRHLRSLPPAPVPSYTSFTCQVRRWSTIHVGSRTYSVPASLIGHTIEARQHPAIVEVFYRGALIERMPRIRGERDHRIDYRHIIAALVRKPGAFARYRFREELFPSLIFRRAYDALVVMHGERADIEYLRVLHLAATTGEARVATALEHEFADGRRFDYAAVQRAVMPPTPTIPVLHLPVPDLTRYDTLLVGGAR